MIDTWSKFNFGFDVDSFNKYLDFEENDVPLTAEISFGNYTLGEGLRAVQDALNSIGHYTYTVSVNRSTNIVTISADHVFELPIVNGPTAANSIFYLLGFRQVTDLSGASTYSGNAPCGQAYLPQFKVQSYVPPEHFIESSDATVNKSADGRIEIVRFGLEQKMEMNLKFITDLQLGEPFRDNVNGLQDALTFLSYISQKKRFEFMPDEDNGESFYKVILESIPGYSKGTGFKLKEMLDRGIADIYETGVMQLRVVQ